MRIGYFGGSFNPPHFGHILAASYAVSRFSLDQIWWAPVHVHAFAKSLISFEQRCDMIQLCLKDLGNKHKLSKVEEAFNSNGRSVMVLRKLKELYPQHEFNLIIGSDTVEHLPKWYKIDELKAEFEICTIPRKNYLADSNDFVIPNVSSTFARKSIAEHKTIDAESASKLRDWIHPQVLDYILNQNLYQKAAS